MELGPLSAAQLILNPDWSSGIYDGKVDGWFGIAGLQLFPEMAVEIVMQYEPDYDWETPYFEFYSTPPNHDWDNAEMRWFGPNSSHGNGRASNQVSFLFGPGSMDWDLAMADGETSLVVDVRGGVVTGLAWRYVPVVSPQGGLTPGAAPELVPGTASEATSQGTSIGPGLRFYDEEQASGQYQEQNARWWKFTPSESGWYVYDVASMSHGVGGTGWSWSSAYWFQGVPGANELPIAHSNYSFSKDSNEAYGLVELTAGVTYYLKVMARPAYGANPEWRVFFDRATWFCGHAGPDQFSAKEIVNPDGFCSDPVPNYGFPAHWYYQCAHTAWWTFTATKSGPLKITPMLSTKDGVRMNQWWMYARLFTNDPYWTGAENPVWIEDINQFSGDGDWGDWEWVEEGRQYWIAVMPYNDYYDRSFEYVLQTRYADHDVVQLENEVVFARTDGNIQPTYPTVPDHLDTTINPQNNSWTGVDARGFQGYMELWRSFGGPQPGDPNQVNNSWTCMWPKARKGQGGTWWYSKYNGVEWDGGEGGGGYGNCPAYVPVSTLEEQAYSDAPVGWHYNSQGGTYGQNYVRVWCMGQLFGLHVTARRIGPHAGLSNDQINAALNAIGGENAGFMAYYDKSYEHAPTGTDEFNVAIIDRVQVAADQQASQWANPGLAPPTEWYVLKSRQADAPGDIYPGWGPWTRGLNYDLRFAGGPQGPESVAAAGELVATYSGGASVWQDIDWQEYWDYEEELMGLYGEDYIDARGMMFVGMNAHHKSDAAPPTPPAMTGWDGPTVNHYVARMGQVLCIKVKVKAQPYMVVFDKPFIGSPGPIPADCPWEWPQPSIDGDYVSGNRRFKAV